VVVKLVNILKVNTKLTHLSLIDCQLGDEDIISLAEGLVDNTTVTHMDLSYNDLGAEGADALTTAIQTGDSPLRSIIVSSSRSYNEGHNLGRGHQQKQELVQLVSTPPDERIPW